MQRDTGHKGMTARDACDRGPRRHLPHDAKRQGRLGTADPEADQPSPAGRAHRRPSWFNSNLGCPPSENTPRKTPAGRTKMNGGSGAMVVDGTSRIDSAPSTATIARLRAASTTR